MSAPIRQQRSQSEDFMPFVEALERRLATKREAPKDPTGLLTLLATRGPLAVPDLMAASGMAAVEFLEVLKTMRDVGLVALVGDPGKERVELTPNGQQVAQLVR